ncbi:MAG: formylglycine-generating enzyme family protein [Planctomycetota bacterium]|jgi:formylglycine-generating enzyme required for sulfatase activity|nr:formylglycine-generating enzyme family protein [Planctomycetota bacterium]
MPCAAFAGDATRVTLPGGVPLDLQLIPAGTFMMGSPESEAGRENDEIQHEVTISKAFYLGTYEVTQAQWKAVMGSDPSKFKGDDNPVENVSWDDAMEFCRRVSELTGRRFRLPTEAEWEYACRAGTTTPFNTGETIHSDQANYFGFNTYERGRGGRKGVFRERTTRVGSFPANAWGLYDMHGNVLEWCSDWLDVYDRTKTRDPQGASSGTFRVYRGGSWFNYPRYCRSAYRSRLGPGLRLNYLGLRVALDQ